MALVSKFYIALPQITLFFVFRRGLIPKNIHWLVFPFDKRALDHAVITYQTCRTYEDVVLFEIDTSVAISLGTRFRECDEFTWAVAYVAYDAISNARIIQNGRIHTYINPYLDITETLKG